MHTTHFHTHTPTSFPIPHTPPTHTFFMAIPIPNQKAGSCALPALKIQVVIDYCKKGLSHRRIFWTDQIIAKNRNDHQNRSLGIMGEQKSLSSEEKQMSPTEKEAKTWKKEVLFITMFAANIFGMMNLSLLAPLFPQEAEAKGVSATIKGMIFGSFPLTQVLTSPLIATLISYAGLKCVFICGIFFAGFWNIIFGFLPLLEDRTLFIVSCFVCRIGMALGTVAINNAAFIIVPLIWPQDIAFRYRPFQVKFAPCFCHFLHPK